MNPVEAPNSGRAPLRYAHLLAIGIVLAWTLVGIVRPHEVRAIDQGSSAAVNSPELRVGIFTDYPPIAFKENNNIKGVEADFARELSEELGLKVTLVEMPFKELIPALRDRRIDVIMSGMSITRDRSKLVAFAEPYLRVGQMALVRKDDYTRLREPTAMDQPTSRVGFQRRTTGELFARGSLQHATLNGFNTAEAGIAALRAGEIDFFIHDAPTIWRTTGSVLSPDEELTSQYRPLTEEYLAWAVRKDDGDALRDRLNTVLARWRKNGELEEILDRWITVRKVAVGAEPG